MIDEGAEWIEEMGQEIIRKVRGYVEKYRMVLPGDTVVAGVSGGADSVCLLLLLKELAEEMRLRLVGVHVNHGIRGAEAERDAAFVKELCARFEVPYVLVEKDVKAYAKRARLSEEEAGREVRYRAFERVLEEHMGGMEGKGKIAVAHNANDQAETVLFHLLRGAGLAGLSGIRPVRGRVIRPVLCLKREEIEAYLREREVSFCIDRTNMEDTYTRNRIRNHIFPYVEKEVCHGAVGHICEAAELVAEAEEYIRRQAQEAYLRCLMDGKKEGVVEFDVGGLLAEAPFLRRQALLLGLGQVTDGRKDISACHMKEMEALLGKEGSKQLSLPYGVVVRKEPLKGLQRLTIRKEEKERLEERKPDPIGILIPGEAEVPGVGKVAFTLLESDRMPAGSGLEGFFSGNSQFIPQKSYTKWFDYDRITKSLVFRIREKGDYFTVHGNRSRKKLKDYMIDEKIPREQRDKIYILAEGNHVLWVPGYRISEYYKVTRETKHILQVQLGGGL